MKEEEFKLKPQDFEEKICNRLFGFRFADPQVNIAAKYNCLMGSRVNWEKHDGLVFIHAKEKKYAFYKDGRIKGGNELFRLKAQGVQVGYPKPCHISHLKPLDHEDELKALELYKLAKVNTKGKFTGDFNRPEKDLIVYFEGDLLGFEINMTSRQDQKEEKIVSDIHENQKSFIPKKKSKKSSMGAVETVQMSFDDVEVDDCYLVASEQIKKEAQEKVVLRHFEKILFFVKVVIPSDASLIPFFEIMPSFKGFVFPYLHLVAFTKASKRELEKCEYLFLKSVAEYEALSHDEKINPNEEQLKIIRKYQYYWVAYHKFLVVSSVESLSVSEWVNKFDLMMDWVDEVKQRPFINPMLKMSF